MNVLKVLRSKFDASLPNSSTGGCKIFLLNGELLFCRFFFLYVLLGLAKYSQTKFLAFTSGKVLVFLLEVVCLAV